ncbi:putative bifunctional diguanylate cyclase/phosphodiesterase [Geodermatophilus ruber]|nr:EAL domain-containing protein [Geodermatophilus ruber]
MVGSGGRLRRLLLSRTVAVLVVVAVLGGLVWSLHGLSARERQRLVQQAEANAAGIVAATVNSHLHAWVRDGVGLSAEGAADLRRDAHQLRQAGRLGGIGIWRLDGTLLFADPPDGAQAITVSPADLARARAGVAWTTAGARVGEQASLRVFLPTHPDGAPEAAHTWLVAVDIPQDPAEGALTSAALRTQITLATMMLLLIGGLLALRRALLRGERRARTDALTGLANHEALVEACAATLPAATVERPAALLLIDLAEFKTINDTLGHLAGDKLLTQIAATLRGLVRAADLVARLGGDEFAVLLTDLPDAAAAQLRAEQLLAALRTATFELEGITLPVDASIGVVLAPRHGEHYLELLQRADVAMYEAKRGHKGTMLYDENRDGHTVDRLQLVGELRRALDRGEFVLHYQPKMALPDRSIYGVEALARWQHPSRGLLPPGEFLPLLESSGLIQPFSKWVVRTAARQAAAWREAGMPLKVAVNLSTRSLLSPALPATVLSIVSGADLPPSLLELEITETALMTNPDLAARVLAQLRARGVEVSIDDFGAGYTSLAFLRVLPITALKIDRSLVSGMLENACDRAVTEAVVDLGHRLGLRVIAEGVETEQLLDALADLGCDRAQGYAIARPMPPAELERWLNDENASEWSGTGSTARQRAGTALELIGRSGKRAQLAPDRQ